jgi:hypothetical protein
MLKWKGFGRKLSWPDRVETALPANLTLKGRGMCREGVGSVCVLDAVRVYGIAQLHMEQWSSTWGRRTPPRIREHIYSYGTYNIEKKNV